MVGKNREICHACRMVGHMMPDCPKKIRCPYCGAGFVKWMEVEKSNEHKGMLFHCCTHSCRFFKWCKDTPEEKCPFHDDGESSGIVKEAENVENLSHMLKSLAKLTEESDLEISPNITMRKGKRVPEEFF